MKSIKVLVYALVGMLSVQVTMAQSTKVIKHEAGETQIPINPSRVVVLDIGSLENYYELGIPVIGGIGQVPTYLPELKADKNYVSTGTVTKVDLEKLATLKPDLIVLGGRLRTKYDSLSAIAPTILLQTNIENFWSSFENNVRTIASIHGKEKVAEQKLKELNKSVEKVKKQAAKDTQKGVFALHAGNRLNPNGPNSRFGFAYDILGLQSAYVAPELKKEAAPAVGEKPERAPAVKLAEINPDYLFIFDRDTGIKGTMPELETLLTDDVRATKAYTNKKVFLLPGNVWYLSGSGISSVRLKVAEVGKALYNIK